MLNFFKNILLPKKELTKAIRGEGRSEAEAHHHAQERLRAWVREEEYKGFHVSIVQTSTIFNKKNNLYFYCLLMFTYKSRKISS